jgi:DNA-binding transcriptional LysR family regulator
MELHQIRYFLALCDELNFTRAAQRCGVAQSSLTRAIKALETELGDALFHRERANTHLSRLGHRVKPFLEQAHSHVEAAKRQAQDFVRLQSGTLRLGLMCTMAPAHLIELMEAMHAHADIRLQIATAPAKVLQERLVAEDIDAAIYALPSLSADGPFNYLPLYRERYIVALSPSHRLALLQSIRVKDLAGEPRVRHAPGEHESIVCDAFARNRVECPTAYVGERGDWVLAAVAAGLGYALMPEMSTNAPGIVTRPLIEPEICRDVALVSVRDRIQAPDMGALVDAVMRWSKSPQAV